jgi:hypothetical protein
MHGFKQGPIRVRLPPFHPSCTNTFTDTARVLHRLPYFSWIPLARISDAKSRKADCRYCVSVRCKQKAESLMLSHYVSRGNCDMAPLWALSPPPHKHTHKRVLCMQIGAAITQETLQRFGNPRSADPKSLRAEFPCRRVDLNSTKCAGSVVGIPASCSAGSELHSRCHETKLYLGLSWVFSVSLIIFF